MQLSCVLDEERIGNEGERGAGLSELRETAFFGWIVNGRKTSCGPSRGGRRSVRELIEERLCIVGSAGISGGAKHQGRQRCC